MRKLLFVILVSVLLLSLYLVRSEGILNVEASADIYQGDLILDYNNVTIIEGYFGINGSIHVKDNATLILRNAVINFTKYGSGILLRYPANGNPRLQAENTEIAGHTYSHLYDNSSATFSNVTGNAYFQFYDETSGSFVDSTLDGVNAREDSTVTVSNSTLQYLDVTMFHGNASLANLSPGFYNHWDFQENCSVTFTPQTEAPELIVNQTTVNIGWSFSFQGNSTATISKCELYVHANGWSVVDARDSIISTVELYESAIATLTNTTYTLLRPFGSTEVYVYWYLDVQVLDDSPAPGQSVQSANVTASFSNGTLVGHALTGMDGWTRLILMEKMTNATGDYHVGTYTVNATYSPYSNGTSLNMIGNQAITITLEGFVIPEFPSFLMLSLFAIATLLAVIAYKRKRYHTV
jgi:hypothetical protein